MNEYNFSLIVNAEFSEALTEDDLLSASRELNQRGCSVASVHAHSRGLEFSLQRNGTSLKDVITSAVAEVERIDGFEVALVEMPQDTRVLVN